MLVLEGVMADRASNREDPIVTALESDSADELPARRTVDVRVPFRATVPHPAPPSSRRW
jgi:hypothetical protein